MKLSKYLNEANNAPDKPSNTEQQEPKNIATFPKKTPGDAGFICSDQVNDRFIHTCVIDLNVEDPNNFFELIQLLYTASEKDIIILKIYTFGGLVETGLDIIQAIFNSKAMVITEALGIVASIGAVIWCCGKKRIISDNATLMFHMPSGVNVGKSLDVQQETSIVCEYFKDLLTRITEGILEPEDISKIVDKRQDLFLNADVVNKRLSLYKQSIEQ